MQQREEHNHHGLPFKKIRFLRATLEIPSFRQTYIGRSLNPKRFRKGQENGYIHFIRVPFPAR